MPHEFDQTPLATEGRHWLTIRVDNRMIVPVGKDAHSVSDQNQGAWNGIIGRIELRSTPRVYVADVQVRPDVASRPYSSAS